MVLRLFLKGQPSLASEILSTSLVTSFAPSTAWIRVLAVTFAISVPCCTALIASEELSSQAQLMREQVGSFRLKNDSGYSASSNSSYRPRYEEQSTYEDVPYSSSDKY